MRQARIRSFRTVLAAGGDRQLAEDAVAEAFTRAYLRWSRVPRLSAAPEPLVAGEFGITEQAAACYERAAGGSPKAAFTFTGTDPDHQLVVAG